MHAHGRPTHLARTAVFVAALALGGCNAVPPAPVVSTPGATARASTAAVGDLEPCTREPGPATGASAPPAQSPDTAPGSAPASPAGPSAEPGSPAASAAPDYQLETIVRDLDQPTFVTALTDPPGVLLVSQRDGLVRVLEADRLFPDPYLDLRGSVAMGSEQGFYALVPHPAYASNGRMFALFTDLEGQLTLMEVRRSDDPLHADPESACLVIRIPMPTEDHLGGGLAFGPDGMLYVGVGDGGGAGDPNGWGQDLAVLQAKVLRLDIESPEAYGIPPDNPFVDTASARPEIWAFGLRNPWRLSVDPQTETLWISDVGQARFEEVNRAPVAEGGINFGWNRMEGPRCYRTDCEPADYTPPIATYGHDPACAVVGGMVARDPSLAELEGQYLFGDFCSGQVWSVPASAEVGTEPRPLLDSDAVVSFIGQSLDGEILVADLAGAVHRLRPAP